MSEKVTITADEYDGLRNRLKHSNELLSQALDLFDNECDDIATDAYIWRLLARAEVDNKCILCDHANGVNGCVNPECKFGLSNITNQPPLAVMAPLMPSTK